MDSLATPLQAFLRENRVLLRLFQRQVPYSTPTGMWHNPEPFAIQSYAIARLHDAWARFCRQLILLSAAGGISTTAGAYVRRSPIVNQKQKPLDVLKLTYTKKRQKWVFWEPKWFDPWEAVQAAQALQIDNFPTVSAGLALTGHGVDELRDCRNFILHRSRSSNRRLDPLRQRIGVSLSTSAEELVNVLTLGGGSIFEEWCIELAQRASLAAQ